MTSTFNRHSQNRRCREAGPPRPNFLMSRDKGSRSVCNDANRIAESYYYDDVVAAVVSDHEEEDNSMDFSTLLQHHYEFNQIEDTSFNKPTSNKNKNNDSSQRSCPITEQSSFYDSTSTLGSLSGFLLEQTNEGSAAHAIEEEVEEALQILAQCYNSSVNSIRTYDDVVSQAGSTEVTTTAKPAGGRPPTSSNDTHTSNQQQGDVEERCLYDDMSTNEYDMIEVADGVMLPLFGTKISLEAIYDGRVTIARCCCCRVNLHCIDKADLVVCPDCYVVSPVVAADADDESNSEDDGPHNFDLHSTSQYNFVGLGFKTKDILDRLEDSS